MQGSLSCVKYLSVFPSTVLKVLLLVLGIYSFMTRDARAYLDPGTGSYVVQVLIATLAGGTYLLISSWARVKEIFQDLISRFSKKKDEKSGR